MKSKIGHSLDYILPEWNIDPRDSGPVCTQSTNAGYLATFTTTALDTLSHLSPAPKGAMIYTATDHGNFALVEGSATLTSAHHSDRGIRAKLLAVVAQGPEVLPQHNDS